MCQQAPAQGQKALQVVLELHRRLMMGWGRLCLISHKVAPRRSRPSLSAAPCSWASGASAPCRCALSCCKLVDGVATLQKCWQASRV